MTLSLFERNLERSSGYPIEVLRNTPIDEFRAMIEKKTGKPTRFTQGRVPPEASTDCDQSCSGLSLIGQRLTTHEECEEAYRQSVRISWYKKVREAYHRFFRRNR